MLATDIPAWVSRYIGVPYQAHGRDITRGADCWGLVVTSLRDVFGVDLPSYDTRYAATLNRAEIAHLIGVELGPWRWVPTDEAREGDVALFLIAGQPSHVGVVVAPPRFLHAQQGTDSCIEDWTRPKWARRMAGIFRHEALA